MPLPYHRPSRSLTEGCAAFLDILKAPNGQQFHGALLVVDGRGEPLEFVYNSVDAPAGFLWPEPRVAEAATLALTRSLFEACVRTPDLLVALARLAPIEVCRRELAPAIPFLLVAPPEGGLPESYVWVNDPPGPSMRADAVFQSLQERGFLLEPFSRIAAGLSEIYPPGTHQEGACDPP
jgi:hypothetical protein